MPTKCTPCREASRICKVHIRSGRCSVYNASNSKRCDIYVTTLEFSRLLKEQASLDVKLKEAHKLVELAYTKLLEANEQFNTAYTKLSRIYESRQISTLVMLIMLLQQRSVIFQNQRLRSRQKWTLLPLSLCLRMIGCY